MVLLTQTRSLPLPHPKYGMWYVEEDFRDAAYRGDLKRVQELLDKYPKLNINAVNEYGETALYIASKKNQSQVVDFLLNQAQLNVDINCQTILGNSPMLVAAWNDNTAIAKKLLEKGADATLTTKADRQYHGGVSALQIAAERNNQELVSLLEKQLGKKTSYQPKP